MEREETKMTHPAPPKDRMVRGWQRPRTPSVERVATRWKKEGKRRRNLPAWNVDRDAWGAG